mmetsp:Transcript_77551/g.171788  ORF Transcript_77551/g.171788 Transcript_77551/m.171788 type:complete len:205 (-) Transcript_77551:134-748(-)
MCVQNESNIPVNICSDILLGLAIQWHHLIAAVCKHRLQDLNVEVAIIVAVLAIDRALASIQLQFLPVQILRDLCEGFLIKEGPLHQVVCAVQRAKASNLLLVINPSWSKWWQDLAIYTSLVRWISRLITMGPKEEPRLIFEKFLCFFDATSCCHHCRHSDILLKACRYQLCHHRGICRCPQVWRQSHSERQSIGSNGICNLLPH